MTLSQGEFLPCILQFGKLHCIYGLEYNIKVLYSYLGWSRDWDPFLLPVPWRGNSL